MKNLKIPLLHLIMLFAFLLSSLFTFAQPNITGVTRITGGQVSVNSVVEIDFKMRYYNEPHNPDIITAYCEFRNKNTSTVKVVQAFYYVDFVQTICDGGCSNPCEILDIIPQDVPPEGINTEEVSAHPFGDFYLHGYWKIRFAPEETGDWEFTIHAYDPNYADIYSSSTNDEFESVNTNEPGFIVKANDRFLKRKTGEFFFPVGENIPTYRDCHTTPDPQGSECASTAVPCEYGATEIKKYIDKIAANNGNFVRIHVNVPGSDDTRAGLSLIGKDFLLAHPTNSNNMFKFDIYNLKDAWQMDEILRHAKEKDVAVEVILFIHSAFGDIEYCDNAWSLGNPFNSTFGGPVPASRPDEIYDVNNTLARKRFRDLIRYMVTRWGSYTSVANWKLWGEADQMTFCYPNTFTPNSNFTNGSWITAWHQEMYNHIITIDPFEHPIGTSFADFNFAAQQPIYNFIDLIDYHHYQSIFNPPNSVDLQDNFGQLENFRSAINFPVDKPCLIGEMGFDNPDNSAKKYDPKGLDLHNSLWSTAFSGAYGSGLIWSFYYVDNWDLYHHFSPVGKFMNSQPELADDFIPTKDNKNGIRYFYMYDLDIPDESIIYGWCQDENFNFKELYTHATEIPLTSTDYLDELNPTYKPNSSSSVNTITLQVTAPSLLYTVEWYNSETGDINSSTTTTSYIVGSEFFIDIEMPLALRTSKYGDAVFKVERNCSENIWREGAYINSVPQNTASNTISSKLTGQTFYGTTTNTINSYWWNGTVWSYVDFGSLATDVAGDLAMSNDELFIYYRSLNNNIKAIWWDASASTWKSEDFTSLTNGNVKGPIVIGPNEEIYYRTNTDDINALIWNGSSWTHSTLNNATIGNVDNSIVVASNGQIFYRTTNDAMNQLWYSGTAWVWGNMSNTVPAGSINSNITIQPNTTKLYWIDTDNEINYVEYDFNIPNWVAKGNPLNWYSNASGDLNAIDNENVIFRNQQGDINLLYFENNEWKWSGLVDNNPEDMVAGTGLAYDDFGNIAYRSTNNTIRRLYYKSICFNTPSTDFRKNDPTTMGTKNLEEKESNKVKIYPNPSNGKFTISSETSIEKWVLKNAIGVSVLTSDKLLKNSDTIDATNLSSGIYFITIVKSNGQESNHKIIIK